MSAQTDTNKQILERFFKEVVNAGNLDLIDELLSEDFVEHEEFPGLAPNRDGVKQFFAMWKGAFPDGSFTTEQMVAEDDLVTARATVRGTHHGEFMGVPATGRTVEVEAIDIIRFADGVMAEHWGVFDALGLMVQLGAIPGPG